MSEVEKKIRKVGRPAKSDSRVADTQTRPKRMSLAKRRNILTVENQDPNYVYRWIADIEDTGIPVMNAKNAGYEFASAEDHHFGDYHVYKTEEGGSSIVRCPAGKGGGYMYLMRIYKDWYADDQKEKEANRMDIENTKIGSYGQGEGTYGGITITRD